MVHTKPVLGAATRRPPEINYQGKHLRSRIVDLQVLYCLPSPHLLVGKDQNWLCYLCTISFKGAHLVSCREPWHKFISAISIWYHKTDWISNVKVSHSIISKSNRAIGLGYILLCKKVNLFLGTLDSWNASQMRGLK